MDHKADGLVLDIRKGGPFQISHQMGRHPKDTAYFFNLKLPGL